MCSSFPLGHNFPYCKFWAFFLAALTPSRAPLQRCRGFVQSLHPGRRERLWLKSERGHPWSAGCWAVDARRQIRGGFTLFLGAKERGMHDACSGPRQAHKAGNRRRGLGANEGVSKRQRIPAEQPCPPRPVTLDKPGFPSAVRWNFLFFGVLLVVVACCRSWVPLSSPRPFSLFFALSHPNPPSSRFARRASPGRLPTQSLLARPKPYSCSSSCGARSPKLCRN